MSQITNKTALITGGASGIGKLMGRSLLEKGLKTLVIWDINEALLATTANEFRQLGFTVYTDTVNVMDTPAMLESAEKVKQEVGTIDILINNAGIIVGKSFTTHTHADIDRTMAINTAALMHITKAFLPSMQDQQSGHIVNIASAAGLVSNPNMSVYVASKWAVIGWSDSLWLEMQRDKTGIEVTTVTPYYISTGMFDGVKSPVIPIVKPATAANHIVKGITKNRRFVRMPLIVYTLLLVKGILPASWFDIAVGKWMGVYHSMDAFKGR